jgi:uncharacterized protein (TIGR00251 family)
MMARISVRVTPRASADRVEGFDAGGALRVRVTAPPVDGQANEAVVRLVAAALGVPSRDVAVVAGAGSRLKIVEVAGVDDAALRARLAR